MKRGTYPRTSEMNKRMSEACKCRIQTQETRDKIRNSLLGKKLSDEHKKNISLNHNKSSGEDLYNWNGGNYNYWHNKAWDMFGDETCQLCGITNDEHLEKFKTRLHMHCEDHDYSNLTRNNWKCVCVVCHGGIDG